MGKHLLPPPRRIVSKSGWRTCILVCLADALLPRCGLHAEVRIRIRVCLQAEAHCAPEACSAASIPSSKYHMLAALAPSCKFAPVGQLSRMQAIARHIPCVCVCVQEMANAPKVIVGADNEEAMNEIRAQARTYGTANFVCRSMSQELTAAHVRIYQAVCVANVQASMVFELGWGMLIGRQAVILHVNCTSFICF